MEKKNNSKRINLFSAEVCAVQVYSESFSLQDQGKKIIYYLSDSLGQFDIQIYLEASGAWENYILALPFVVDVVSSYEMGVTSEGNLFRLTYTPLIAGDVISAETRIS